MRFNTPFKFAGLFSALFSFSLFFLSTSPAFANGNDIVVTNGNTATVSVFQPGTTTAGFVVSSATPTGNSPNTMERGDINEDGFEDLVVVNGNNNGDRTLNFLFGDGTGSFATQSPLQLGYEANDVALGDFDNDNHLDLMVSEWAGSGGNRVQIFLGDGAGNFALSTTWTTNIGPGANGIALADYNEDGNLDGVVSNWNSSNVTVLFGNGAGGIISNLVYTLPAGTRPQSLQGADIDGDNNADFVIPHGLSQFLGIYFGNGDGTFQARVDVAAGVGSSGTGLVRIADINKDGYGDLITQSGPNNSISLSVFLSNGNSRTFGPAIHSPIENFSDGIDVTDFDKDGHLDLVLSNRFYR